MIVDIPDMPKRRITSSEASRLSALGAQQLYNIRAVLDEHNRIVFEIDE